jgi:hypothetical protein
MLTVPSPLLIIADKKLQSICCSILIVLGDTQERTHAIQYHLKTKNSVFKPFSGYCSKANRSLLASGDKKGKYQRLGDDACSSFWFHRFIEGCKICMGQDWRPNKAISKQLMLQVLLEAEHRINLAPSQADLNCWIVFHSYALVCYVVSLRGCKGLLLDLSGLRQKWEAGGDEYVVITLLGKLKGETGDRAHLLPLMHVTSFGINVHDYLKRLLDFKRSIGQISGPTVSSTHGKIFTTRSLNNPFLEISRRFV